MTSAAAGAFGQVMAEFVDTLASTFPEQAEFRKLSSGLALWRMAAPAAPLESFRSGALTDAFRQAVFTKNDAFFLTANAEPTPELSGVLGGQTTFIRFVDTLRCLWHTLDEDNRMVVWKYLTALVLIADGA